VEDTRVGQSLILKMSDRSFFEQKMSDLGNRSFCANFCSFALFERAIKRAIALLQ